MCTQLGSIARAVVAEHELEMADLECEAGPRDRDGARLCRMLLLFDNASGTVHLHTTDTGITMQGDMQHDDTPIINSRPIIYHYLADTEHTHMHGTRKTNASLIADAIWVLGGRVEEDEIEREVRCKLLETLPARIFNEMLADLHYNFEVLWWVTFDHPSFKPWLDALEMLRRVDTACMVQKDFATDNDVWEEYKNVREILRIRFPDTHPEIQAAWDVIFAEKGALYAMNKGDWAAWADHTFTRLSCEHLAVRPKSFSAVHGE